jgi:hypothetical protein
MELERRGRRPAPARPVRIEQGIVKILRAPARRDEERVAVGGRYSPAYSPTRQRLDQLYAMPNLDDYLIEQTAPDILEGSLLLPQRFAAGLEAALALLEREQQRDAMRRQSRVIKRAREVLSDQIALRDLLRTYLSALYKG